MTKSRIALRSTCLSHFDVPANRASSWWRYRCNRARDPDGTRVCASTRACADASGACSTGIQIAAVCRTRICNAASCGYGVCSCGDSSGIGGGARSSGHGRCYSGSARTTSETDLEKESSQPVSEGECVDAPRAACFRARNLFVLTPRG